MKAKHVSNKFKVQNKKSTNANNKLRKEPGRYFDENKPFKKLSKGDANKSDIGPKYSNNKKIIFDDDGNVSERPRKNKTLQSFVQSDGGNEHEPKNTRLVFDDEEMGGLEESRASEETSNVPKPSAGASSSYKERKPRRAGDEDSKAWYTMYEEYNAHSDLVELKDTELRALTDLCKSSFETELPQMIKRNPSDAKWLQTALRKGTAKDRVNSGALLVHSNPVANLEAMETLIGLCKVSNRVGAEVLNVLSELFMEALIPSHRKLLNLPLRGADWKAVRSREDVSIETKSKIYAHWHFEDELKDQYFEFLKNLQQCLQTGQEPIRNAGIACAAKLLCHGPEKEQLLLSMLVNKLGDPTNKVAAKALHHLSEVAYKHPNMCGVITNETEKLLFRNNISEQAQHFALCFLAQIAPNGHSDVCTKLVNICFAFFKVMVNKGSVNTKTMQAILRCLQKAIVDAKPVAGSTEIMSKEMQDTIYRLVHLADIQISIQTLSLLLQLITVKGEKSDRFYNALYRKLLDLNIVSVGSKAAAQFFHILHRAIHSDPNIPRAMAFIKRLLQISLYMPPHMGCGCLIIINKILKARPELRKVESHAVSSETTPVERDLDLSRFDGDEDEADMGQAAGGSSWYHIKLKTMNLDVQKKETELKENQNDNYDAYHRVPAFAGASSVDRYELMLLHKHFHPTCKLFAETVIAEKVINYYGDPLRDFSTAHFLERFAFKNPRKAHEKKDGEDDLPAVKLRYNKPYTPQAGRAKPVQSLTKENCTEEERFIFQYLEKKRERQISTKRKDEDIEVESVDDDEFDAYLDKLCKKSNAVSEDEDGDIDFMTEMGAGLKLDDNSVGKKKKSKTNDDDDSDAGMDDWSDEENQDGGSAIDIDEANDDSDEGSISLEEEEDDDDDEAEHESNSSTETDEGENDSLLSADEEADFEENDMSDDEEAEESISENENDCEPKAKKVKKGLASGKQFSQMLKKSGNMNSLFAAADDFAELLEKTSKEKKHGTSSAIFNSDKSSEKQLKWEEKRRKALSGKQFANKRNMKIVKKNKKRK